MSYTNKTTLFLKEKNDWFDFWCLAQLSAIFQLYHGSLKEKLEVTKREIRICKSKKDRQYNDQNKKTKGTNNDL